MKTVFLGFALLCVVVCAVSATSEKKQRGEGGRERLAAYSQYLPNYDANLEYELELANALKGIMNGIAERLGFAQPVATGTGSGSGNVAGETSNSGRFRGNLNIFGGQQQRGGGGGLSGLLGGAGQQQLPQELGNIQVEVLPQ
ncbi:uncharacterized protein LOC106654155 [Trichogramma pretiosum]|uniref:uncharacterized protein LOC106654155 n=1 Tax=Trichogramma pretiosum TaxID=7493 RepID=UPI0006C97996|nr:uncharacterized protein LOC106654155 [Trichogramma pretiosum]